jgi:hypothetical protein
MQYYRAAVIGGLGDAGIETQAQELFAAFLRQYFDGGAHLIAGQSMPFPEIDAEDYSWDTDQPRAMGEGKAQIHGIFGELRPAEPCFNGSAERLMQVELTVTWRCRVPSGGDPDHKGKRLAKQVASRLAMLMERGSSPAADLGGKGIARSHVLRLPVNVPFSDYWVYQLITSHGLRYTRPIDIQP